MPFFTGRNDLTTISSRRFDIKALKSDVQWNPGFFEPVDVSTRLSCSTLYNKTESVVFMT